MHTSINIDFKLKFKFSFKIMLSILIFKFFSMYFVYNYAYFTWFTTSTTLIIPLIIKLTSPHRFIHPSIASKTIAHLKLVPDVQYSLRCRKLNAFNIPSRRCLLGGHSITIVCACVYCVLMFISANGKFLKCWSKFVFFCIEKEEILLCRHFGRLSFRQSDVIFLS